MIIGVVKEDSPRERRVALIPPALKDLKKGGMELIVESGAGVEAGHLDEEYVAQGARLVGDRAAVFAQADVVVGVAMAGANPEFSKRDVDLLRDKQTVIAMMEPLFYPDEMKKFATTGANVLAMELIPRITRAQSMDVLSSQASIAGYKAVLMAACELPKLFPMMMTAAGTIPTAKVLVIGAGVAGLQAIATAKRLGAMVSAYDVRPAVKEQVESVGGRFVELAIDTAQAEDKGGYAKEQTEEQIRKQQELMAQVVAESDAVITTAAIPGRKSPIIVTEAMVKKMTPGSVIVDLAAERGGNCELTQGGQTIEAHQVKIMGPTDLPSTVPHHSSQMYSKNISTLLLHLVKEGKLTFDLSDEITAETLVSTGGQIVHSKVRQLSGLPPLEAPVSEKGSAS